MRDGIEEEEALAIALLVNITNDDMATARSLIDIDWVQDGITRLEVRVVGGIAHFAFERPQKAAMILGMHYSRRM